MWPCREPLLEDTLDRLLSYELTPPEGEVENAKVTHQDKEELYAMAGTRKELGRNGFTLDTCLWTGGRG